MNLTKEAVICIIKSNTEAGAVKLINEAEITAAAVASLNRQANSIREECNRNLVKIENDLSFLRQKCSHPVIRRNPDPSGGNDRFAECLVCGKEL